MRPTVRRFRCPPSIDRLTAGSLPPNDASGGKNFGLAPRVPYLPVARPRAQEDGSAPAAATIAAPSDERSRNEAFLQVRSQVQSSANRWRGEPHTANKTSQTAASPPRSFRREPKTSPDRRVPRLANAPGSRRSHGTAHSESFPPPAGSRQQTNRHSRDTFPSMTDAHPLAQNRARIPFLARAFPSHEAKMNALSMKAMRRSKPNRLRKKIFFSDSP